MKVYTYKKFKIILKREYNYNPASADNNTHFSQYYCSPAENDCTNNSQVGIWVYKDEVLINNCVIASGGGGTGISENTTMIDSDLLFVCCGDSLFCLSLPGLELYWHVKADNATCFQVFKLEDDYCILGEIGISRITKNGYIKWQFSGQDILVTTDGTPAIEFRKGIIYLTDFSGNKYDVDYNGRLIQ